MLLIALTPADTDGGSISAKMAGVVLASLSSGGGELVFLGLTHFYGPFSLAAWGSGTGAAGLVGAGAYAIATTALNMKVRTALLASSFLPVLMLLSYFLILPRGVLKKPVHTEGRNETSQTGPSQGHNLPRDTIYTEAERDEPSVMDRDEEEEGLLAGGKAQPSRSDGEQNWWKTFKSNLVRARGLFFPL